MAVTRATSGTELTNAFNITIDHTKVDEDLYDFPILVNLGNNSGISGFDSTKVFDNVSNVVDAYNISTTYINPAITVGDSYKEVVATLLPTAHYRLGEASDTVAVDEMGNYNGTYIGSPTLGVDGLLVGDTDTAVSFDGVDDYVNLNTLLPSLQNYNTGSISYVFKLMTSGEGATISTGDSNTTATFMSTYVNETRCEFYYKYDGEDLGEDNFGRTADVTLELNRSYHVVFVQDDSEGALIYLDGVKLPTYTRQGEANAKWWQTASSLTDTLSVNGLVRSSTSYTKGTVDEVAIFTTALTQEQITTLYEASTTGTPSDTTIYSRQCKVEIDRWDQANKQAQLWVKVPYISKDVDTTINLSFASDNEDNSDNIGATGTTPAQAVWEDYDAVYHLSDASGADSTANGLDGTLINMDSGNIVDFGIGKGLNFNGVNERINLPVLPYNNTSNLFAHAIYNTDVAQSSGFSSILSFGKSIGYRRIDVDSNTPEVILYNYDGTQRRIGYTYTKGDLINIDCAWDMVSTNGEIFIDGVSHLTGAIGIESNPDPLATYDSIGDAEGNDAFLEGDLMELRLSSSIKTSSYIATNYESTKDSLATFSYADPYMLNTTYSEVVLDLSPVAYWRLGDSSGTTAVDETGNYDGTYVGSPSLGENGLLIDDSDTAVGFTTAGDQEFSNLTLDQSFWNTAGSISLSIKLTDWGNASGMIFFIGSQNTSSAFIMHRDALNNVLALGNWGATYVIPTLDSLDKTYHIVVTYEGTEAKVYVDGILVNTFSSFSTTISSNALYIASAPDSKQLSLGVTIDDTALFDKVLTQEQITGLYTSSRGAVAIATNYRETVLNLLPTAYWRLGDSSGTTAVDETGNYDGTYVGSPSLGESGLLTGDDNTAVSFDGVDDHVSIADNVELRNIKSISCVISSIDYASGDTYSPLVSKGYTDYNLQVRGADSVITFISSGVSELGAGSIQLLPNVEYSIVAVFDNTFAKVYVNGVLDIDVTFSVDLHSGTRPLRIGSDDHQGAITYASAFIDEVALFSTALTQEQVTSLYQASLGNF
ncbi:MAG: LamG domain-containing protein [Desulfobacteraceae bacterium]|nr:LamG domain-containing protein [Desulfobacteraceae bacterium]